MKEGDSVQVRKEVLVWHREGFKPLPLVVGRYPGWARSGEYLPILYLRPLLCSRNGSSKRKRSVRILFVGRKTEQEMYLTKLHLKLSW